MISRAARFVATLLAVCAAFAAAPAAAQDSAAVRPPADSVGGDSIARRLDVCPAAGYCERVALQVQRFFRAPQGSAGVRGEVCFRIQRDGSVTDIRAQRVVEGGAAFRLAMMEAVEEAGHRRAFGPLPPEFVEQPLWCLQLAPR
jgi:hypothetical protein